MCRSWPCSYQRQMSHFYCAESSAHRLLASLLPVSAFNYNGISLDFMQPARVASRAAAATSNPWKCTRSCNSSRQYHALFRRKAGWSGEEECERCAALPNNFARFFSRRASVCDQESCKSNQRFPRNQPQEVQHGLQQRNRIVAGIRLHCYTLEHVASSRPPMILTLLDIS